MTAKIILCRCEDVSRHDLEEALRAGYQDLESVKRYTGFGTGVCQGKQCMRLCAVALARLGGEVDPAPFTPRPPLHPTPLAQLAGLSKPEPEKP